MENRTGIDRRVLLEAAVALLAGSTGAHAFPSPAFISSWLPSALKRARRNGRPVLVLVVPSDSRARAARARIWGAFLSESSSGLYADLALCELVCADMRDVRRRVPAARKLVGEPWALLLGALGTTVTELAGDLRNHGMEARLRELILPDAASLARLGALCTATLTTFELRRVERELAGGSPGIRTLDSAPALVRAWAEAGGAARQQRIAMLAAHARNRLWPALPTGESADPCAGGPCGTAFIPATSRRFLWFFTRP